MKETPNDPKLCEQCRRLYVGKGDTCAACEPAQDSHESFAKDWLDLADDGPMELVTEGAMRRMFERGRQLGIEIGYARGYQRGQMDELARHLQQLRGDSSPTVPARQGGAS